MSHMPVTDNWAITKLNVIDTSLTWTIKNFSYNMTKFGERIYSPLFTVQEGDYKWCLDLYPSGESDPDYIGLYLHLKNANPASGMVKYQFSILNHRGEVAHQIKWSEVCEIEPGSAWGYEKFLAKTRLNNGLLPNDSLTILCEIKVSADSLAVSGKCSVKGTTPESLYKSEMDLSIDLIELYNTSHHSDVVIIADERKFLAHKCILSVRSSFFRDLLKTTYKNDIHLDAIKINDCESDVMDEVLRYIYSGHVNNLSLNTSNLLAAAKKFNLPGLKLLCEKNFIKGLNALNVGSLLLLADLHNAEKLKEKSMKFIISNLKDVYDTPGYNLLKMSNPKLISEIFNMMAKNSNTSEESSKKKKKIA